MPFLRDNFFISFANIFVKNNKHSDTNKIAAFLIVRLKDVCISQTITNVQRPNSFGQSPKNNNISPSVKNLILHSKEILKSLETYDDE